MGPLATLLGFPVTMPLAGLGWIAGKVAEAAMQQAFDPARIESALLARERRLESGEIIEEEFEAREQELPEEPQQIRAVRAELEP